LTSIAVIKSFEKIGHKLITSFLFAELPKKYFELQVFNWYITKPDDPFKDFCVSQLRSTELNIGLRSFFSRQAKIAKSTAGKDITKNEVRALFSLWNNELATGDSQIITSPYAVESGAVLLPTFSDVPRKDFDSIKDYFDAFLLKEPQGEIVEGDIRIGNGWAQDCGIYEFTIRTTGDKIKARYSYVYVYEGDQCKISHHHSSVMPEHQQ
jgi:hypothetical protein